MQAGHHAAVALAKRYEPRSFAILRCRRNDEIKAVSELAEHDDRTREKTALAIDFRPNVLADARPPDVPFGDQRWRMLAVMEPFFHADPEQKLLHAFDILPRELRSPWGWQPAGGGGRGWGALSPARSRSVMHGFAARKLTREKPAPKGRVFYRAVGSALGN